MTVIFFTVENVLNFQGSDAKAPDGSLGIAENRVGWLKSVVKNFGARIVLIGDWTKDWDFDDSLCTKKGIYLNKKLNRHGLHILCKTENIDRWLEAHPNVTKYWILKEHNELPEWVQTGGQNEEE